MRKFLFVIVIAVAFAWAANASRTPNARADNGDTSNPGEPITDEQPTAPTPGSESVVKSPFEPYGIGPTSGDDRADWSYQQLSGDEQAYADRNRDASQWGGIHDAYKSAIQRRAEEAATNAAAIQLGIDNLGGVP